MKARRLSRELADWSLYIVRCRDGSLYTGVAKDIEARVETHNAGRGAAYTRSRRPVELIYSEEGFTRSEALMREAEVKSLPRCCKRLLAGLTGPAAGPASARPSPPPRPPDGLGPRPAGKRPRLAVGSR